MSERPVKIVRCWCDPAGHLMGVMPFPGTWTDEEAVGVMCDRMAQHGETACDECGDADTGRRVFDFLTTAFPSVSAAFAAFCSEETVQ